MFYLVTKITPWSKTFLSSNTSWIVIINEIALHSEWPGAVEEVQREKEKEDGLISRSTQARSFKGAATFAKSSAEPAYQAFF